MKQETLEEVAKGYAEANKFLSDRPFEFNRDLVAFINGAKWQQERSYSEEEVRQLFQKYISTQIPLSRLRVILHKDLKDWFEKFKKK